MITMQQLLYISIIIYSFIALMFALTFWWMNKNRTMIKYSEYKDGALQLNSVRGRVVKEKFHPMMGLKPIDKYVHVKHNDHFMVFEGLPFLGCNKVLLLFKGDKEYLPVEPDFDILESKITDTMLSWVAVSRQELFENTKPKMSAADIAREVILPISIIILAVMCLIFFPKIYEQVTAATNAAISSSTGAIADTVNKFIPLG